MPDHNFSDFSDLQKEKKSQPIWATETELKIFDKPESMTVFTGVNLNNDTGFTNCNAWFKLETMDLALNFTQ
jgi:hypothetical protein